MRDLKKLTSRKISQELENDGEKLFLYVSWKTAEQREEKGNMISRAEYDPQIALLQTGAAT